MWTPLHNEQVWVFPLHPKITVAWTQVYNLLRQTFSVEWKSSDVQRGTFISQCRKASTKANPEPYWTTEHLWDEVECRLQARPITQHQHLTKLMSSCVSMRANPHRHVPTFNGKSCQNSGSGEGGPIPYDFEIKCLTSTPWLRCLRLALQLFRWQVFNLNRQLPLKVAEITCNHSNVIFGHVWSVYLSF